MKRVKAGELRLKGFGYRVYKNYDPRARILTEMAAQVFEVTGKSPLLEIVVELERIARPRQAYTGADQREYVPIGKRS